MTKCLKINLKYGSRICVTVLKNAVSSTFNICLFTFYTGSFVLKIHEMHDSEIYIIMGWKRYESYKSLFCHHIYPMLIMKSS